MKTYELPCYDSRKSFYNKANVIEDDNGTKALQSYSTIVASVDTNGEFHRHWGGYSPTTMRHVNSFLAHFNIEGGGKSWWDDLETERR